MLQLLNPIGLLAMAGILVPVLIHLWSKKQEKTTKVGSIRWLEASESRKLSSIKLNDFWLMLLRCAIIAVLALVIAQPRWLSAGQPSPRKEVFISPVLLQQQALELVSSTIDSLLQAGYRLKELGPHFSTIAPDQWAAYKQQEGSINTSQVNYWHLLEMQLQELSAEDTLWFFADAQQRHYKGQRPLANSNIYWISTPVEEENQWLQSVWQTSQDSLLLLFGQSNRQSTSYTKKHIGLRANQQSLKTAGWPELTFIYQQGVLQAAATVNDTVAVQQALDKVIVYADSSTLEDADYVKAAVQAAVDYLEFPASVIGTRDSLPQLAGAGWLFWLSEKPLPAAIRDSIRAGLHVFQYRAAGEVVELKNNQFLTSTGAAIALHKVASGENTGFPLWRDSHGNAVLSKVKQGEGELYSFSSRFNNKWTDLPESETFPELVLELLVQKEVKASEDVRVLDAEQVLPVMHAPVKQKSVEKAAVNISPWLVLLAMLLIAMERFWVYQRKWS